jgi:hypothetical protein
MRGQAQTQAEPGVVAEVAEAPGIQPVFVDPPAAHTILVIKLQNRGLATSDCRVSESPSASTVLGRRHDATAS